jgi:hypothetical protein
VCDNQKRGQFRPELAAMNHTSIARPAILLLLFAICVQVDLSQDLRERETLAVKKFIGENAATRPKVSVLFRSLVSSEGKLTKFDEDSFYLKKGRKYFRSFYRDVLEIRSGDKFLSNTHDPSTPSHGAWSDINQIYPATRILVVLTDGRIIKGFSNSATASQLIMIDNKTDIRLDVPKDQVAALFGLIGGNGGIRSGAAKGSEGLLQPGGDPIVGGIGAVIGAIIGALTKSDGRPVLVYSR